MKRSWEGSSSQCVTKWSRAGSRVNQDGSRVDQDGSKSSPHERQPPWKQSPPNHEVINHPIDLDPESAGYALAIRNSSAYVAHLKHNAELSCSSDVLDVPEQPDLSHGSPFDTLDSRRTDGSCRSCQPCSQPNGQPSGPFREQSSQSTQSTRRDDSVPNIRREPSVELLTSLYCESSKTRGTDFQEPSESQVDGQTPRMEVSSFHRDAQTIASIFGDEVDINEVYSKLKERRRSSHRVQSVTNDLIDQSVTNDLIDQSVTNDLIDGTHVGSGQVPPKGGHPPDIVNDVEYIASQYPTIDPNEIFDLLDLQASHSNRRRNVMGLLRVRCIETRMSNDALEAPVVSDVDEVIDVEAQNVRNHHADPLYRDMLTVSGMFPGMNRRKIYAYLEAHYGNPNRVEVVVEELLSADSSRPDTDYRDFATNQNLPTASGDQSTSNGVTCQSGATSHEVTGQSCAMSQIERDVEELKPIFPDCDPDYLFESLECREDDPDRVQTLAQHMFNTRLYPKLKDRLKAEENHACRRRLETAQFDTVAFLRAFSDPMEFFYDESRSVTRNYKEHAIVQLHKYFPFLKLTYIESVLEKHKHHFTPALRTIESQAPKLRKRTKKTNHTKTRQNQILRFPDEPDDIFFKERLFCQHEAEIKLYLDEREAARRRRLHEARLSGELQTCSCCYDDEVLPEDTRPCAYGHAFCRTCIRRSTEVSIGQGRTSFSCLSSGCQTTFSTSVLQAVLPPSVFSNALRRLQAEEIRRADIPDLACCPFCPFATIMPPEDKLLKCLNQECLKESCRLCQELNHIPLRCDEVEKRGETKARTFIENRVTEAMLRTCWKCKKRFFKEEGCNKMTCTCGASMCYLCRKPVEGYDHFGNPPRCPPDTDVRALHKREMMNAGQKAKDELGKDDESVLNLKYDPMTRVEDYSLGDPYLTYQEDEDSDYGEDHASDEERLY